ncbi:protein STRICTOSIDINE SYNTHASE-LIKE 10-like [Aristolochia californica]|uniref:protein STRICTOSIDINE SYNTHASE-LIKE 10-like n=1 Tax=Aristolochia californica TaxID=171875 RepID=UPI0035E0E113
MASSRVVFLLLLAVVFANIGPSLQQQYRRLRLVGAVGPESFAFDNAGGGPYTGTSDGRVMRWNGSGWVGYATQPNRNRAVCDGSSDPSLEGQCGRPLGLQFNRETDELYVADAYHGLLVVGARGGVATPIVTSVEGRSLIFTNAVDIDQTTGMVYFSDSSAVYTRRDHDVVVSSGDRTGRVMSYNPRTRQVRVLLRGLPFANGVAVSRDRSFLLVSETSTSRVMRYWLQGPRTGSYELFASIPGYPDNIRRNSRGEFWVGVAGGRASNPGTGTVIGMKFNSQGGVLQEVGSLQAGSTLSVSEIEEHNGALWIGSVDEPFAGVYRP